MKRILSLVLFMFMSVPSHTAPINYDESLDGDLNLSQALLFDIGVNTLKGTTRNSAGSNVSRDMDDFIFTLNSGTRLNSVFIEVFNIVAGSSVVQSPRIIYTLEIYEKGASSMLEAGFGDFYWFDSLQPFNKPVLEDFIPSTFGDYVFTLGRAFGGTSGDACAVFDDSCSLSFDYRLNFDVSEVNSVGAPLSVFMFLVVITAFAFFRKS